VDALTSALTGREDVEFAYVYGSFLGDGPFRDIDVAIWAAPIADSRLDLDLAVQLTRACQYPVDVRCVNHAPVAFLFHVFRGEALLVRDERRLADLIERTARTYHDLAPLLRQAVRDAFAA
jgi:predicted nucleotidyltransferase